MNSPTILYEDTHLVVLSKPAGLLSQGEITGDENLVDWLRGHFGRNYVGLVHRLDRNTSGLMVVAKRTKSANRLTEALQEGTLIRTYRAWLVGNLEKPAKWTHFLSKDEKLNQVRVVSSTAQGAKRASLDVRPIQHGKLGDKLLTLAEFQLETGRSHQIRVQAAHEGFPLLGDKKYGGGTSFPRPALHSHRISFPHPMTGERIEFEDELPQDMRSIQPLR
jgi:23S rRNA pseudouridine1911/1915/1917 synthase